MFFYSECTNWGNSTSRFYPPTSKLECNRQALEPFKYFKGRAYWLSNKAFCRTASATIGHLVKIYIPNIGLMPQLMCSTWVKLSLVWFLFQRETGPLLKWMRGRRQDQSWCTSHCCHREQNWDLHSPYSSWDTLKVSSPLTIKWVYKGHVFSLKL